MVAIMEEAEKQNTTLSKGFIRQIALELAGELGIPSFKASKQWFNWFEQRLGRSLGDGRKLRRNRSKISPWIRLTFGEKHEIANFIRENPRMSLVETAKIFTERLNRSVTWRLILL